MIFRVKLDKTTPHQRGEYLSLTSAQKFLIGKHAAENGVTATVKYYSKAFPHDLPNSPFFDQPSGNTDSFGDSPIYYCQNFIMQVFTKILPYQYFITYSILVNH